MGLKQFGEKVENGKVTLFLRRALSSYYFPLVTAAVSILGYYAGLEIITIWYLCLCGTAIMICCKDVSPVICILLFLTVLISMKHSPLKPVSSTYLLSPAILAQEITGVVFFIGSMIFRLVTSILNRRFKITPTFWGLVAFSVALMIGGVFYTHYTIMNFVFGLGLAAVLVGVYTFICGNVTLNKQTILKIAYYFLIWFAVATIELVVAYLTTEGLIVDGKVIRSMLKFGWGTYNQLGLILTMTIPAWFYFAGRYKYGVFFLLGGLFNLGMCFLSMARQAMLMGVIIFVLCCIWLLIWDKGKKRLINACVMCAVILFVAIAAAIMHDKVGHFFSSLLNSLKTGSGRTDLWMQGMENFLSKPIFGVGFYDPLATPPLKDASGNIIYNGDVGYFGGNISASVPRMCHNTVFQILSACGLVGLITYVIHRTQTVISLINNITNERIFIALTACALVLLSLLDNHIFSVLPTIIYAALIAMLTITEKKDLNEEQKVII